MFIQHKTTVYTVQNLAEIFSEKKQSLMFIQYKTEVYTVQNLAKQIFWQRVSYRTEFF